MLSRDQVKWIKGVISGFNMEVIGTDGNYSSLECWSKVQVDEVEE